ncbi:MBL fold metallo-hydrolase [Nesterenkonia sp. MY13]|uniref:MBL fold metallo-hydrolase n=1 Tax=Nesterenkonia sedimenti TaxID=1463632 RepID=A0A7X8YEF8_9MICC|nr:ComEC/Rec2 family competence protein [Nesterenkonia sedimenti]NLS10177.1 MBL fold metallo-hydrolase [Nesterenkonia sedimenti]
MSRSIKEAQPLDLRLLPAVLVLWPAAFFGVGLTVTALRVTATVLVLAAALGIGCWLLTSARRRLRGISVRSLLAHSVLCAGVAAAVLLTVANTKDGWVQSGWADAVASDVPVEVTLRITGDAQPLQSRGFDGTDQVRLPVRVLSYRSPGGETFTAVGAEAVAILPAQNHASAGSESTTAAQAPLEAGSRYRGLMQAGQTASTDRVTAVLRPFGSEGIPRQLEPDLWSEVMDRFNGLRQATAEQSQHTLGEAPALLPGVILGDRSGQGAELTDAMRISGLTHMTVVSGTHCALVMGALLGLMRITGVPRWWIPPVLLAGLATFVMLVQPAPSVIRAAVMGGIGALAVFAGRGRTSSALLCLCVVLLLLYDPWFAREAAFQLSVAATAGIVLVGARLNLYFQRWLPGFIAAPLALASSAQLFVTPVLLPLAEGITLYSIPANILAGPLLPLVTVPGTAAAVISTALPWVSQALLWLAGFPAAAIALIGHSAAALPQALAPWPQGVLGWVLAGIYTAAAVLICRAVITGSLGGRGQRLLLSCTAGGLIAVVVPGQMLMAGILGRGLPEDWRLALCDVGQGHMLVIRTAEQSGIVVDAGQEPAEAQRCLNQLAVEQVQILMITHDHADHYGGTPGVLAAADVETVLYSASAGWAPSEALEFEELPELRAEVGQEGIHEGQYPLSWEIWAAADWYPNPNDNSLVVSFDLWDAKTPVGAVGSANNPLRLLAMGDLEEEVTGLMITRDALPAEVDVLKVSHHGAANGGTEILERTQPTVALIGVGEDNTYGHPAAEILESLEALGAGVYRTDLHGTVVFSLAAEGGELTPRRLPRTKRRAA